jgi:hypothetical protein
MDVNQRPDPLKRERNPATPITGNPRIAGNALCRTRTDDPLAWKGRGVTSVHRRSRAGTKALQIP